MQANHQTNKLSVYVTEQSSRFGFRCGIWTMRGSCRGWRFVFDSDLRFEYIFSTSHTEGHLFFENWCSCLLFNEVPCQRQGWSIHVQLSLGRSFSNTFWLPESYYKSSTSKILQVFQKGIFIMDQQYQLKLIFICKANTGTNIFTLGRLGRVLVRIYYLCVQSVSHPLLSYHLFF